MSLSDPQFGELVATALRNDVGGGPRSRIAELLRRPEASRTGIYVQIGPDPDHSGELLAYIGEADDVAARIPQPCRL